MASRSALLYRVPRHQHELQPTVQTHWTLRPRSCCPLGILPPCQTGTNRYLQTRWTKNRTQMKQGFVKCVKWASLCFCDVVCVTGCFSKDQVYLDGILRLLRHRRNIDFKILTSLGKVSLCIWFNSGVRKPKTTSQNASVLIFSCLNYIFDYVAWARADDDLFETVQSLEYFLILCHLMVELYNKVVFVNISSCIILTWTIVLKLIH